MRKISVRLKDRSYQILIGSGIIPQAGEMIKGLSLGKDAFIITNKAVENRGYLKPVVRALSKSVRSYSVTRIPGTETSKSFDWVVKLTRRIVKADKGRGIFIVVLGGGTTGDIGGYLASAYKRGIPYIQIPTTLLAQVDSSIGGKTAIDLASGKNLIGAFYQPRLVVSDINFLRGLNDRVFRSALGEIIKYGVISDSRLFSFIEKNLEKIIKRDRSALEYIIYRSSKIKAETVEKDEYDRKGIRAKLNFGHTVGHAIETASEYSRLESCYHGEAIAIGMVAAVRIANEMNILDSASCIRIERLIERAGLPTKISRRLNLKRIMAAMKRDKKVARGVNRFVLPTAIGRVKLYDKVPRGTVLNVLKGLTR